MAASMEPLQARMEAAKDVHIVGPGTDLRFSIDGIPVVGCAGTHNIPDGEMFTAPVRDSVEGKLSVNTASLHEGIVFDQIVLEFSGGKITQASANHSERLNRILDRDEGARHIGEFSLGFNPKVLHPMMDTLFDEKIAGSFHFTPGSSVRGRRQRQSIGDPLGSGDDPATGVRRRRSLLRQGAHSEGRAVRRRRPPRAQLLIVERAGAGLFVRYGVSSVERSTGIFSVAPGTSRT